MNNEGLTKTPLPGNNEWIDLNGVHDPKEEKFWKDEIKKLKKRRINA